MRRSPNTAPGWWPMGQASRAPTTINNPPYEPDPAHNPNPAADAAAYATAEVAQARLVFLHSKDEELPLPVGLAGYILAGISYGFINNWQLACWGGEGCRSHYLPAIEEALVRFASGK